jgi:hypothetical protein
MGKGGGGQQSSIQTVNPGTQAMGHDQYAQLIGPILQSLMPYLGSGQREMDFLAQYKPPAGNLQQSMPQWDFQNNFNTMQQLDQFAQQSPHMKPQQQQMQTGYFPTFHTGQMSPVTRPANTFENLLGGSVQQPPSYPYALAPDFGSRRT